MGPLGEQQLKLRITLLHTLHTRRQNEKLSTPYSSKLVVLARIYNCSVPTDGRLFAAIMNNSDSG